MRDETCPKLIKEWSPMKGTCRGRPKPTRSSGIQSVKSEANLHIEDWKYKRRKRLEKGKRSTL